MLYIRSNIKLREQHIFSFHVSRNTPTITNENQEDKNISSPPPNSLIFISTTHQTETLSSRPSKCMHTSIGTNLFPMKSMNYLTFLGLN